MKINYVENKNGKLFSFHRHDYKDNIDDEDNYIMIDGGFDDYIRCSGELKSGTFVLDMGCEPSSEYWEEVKKNLSYWN